MLTLKGPSGKEFTDFASIGFTIETKDGKSVTVKANRCGSTTGGGSMAIVSVDGVEKFKSETPDAALQKKCDEQGKADPEMMPYFFLQHDDYITLKETATSHILSGKEGPPPGMATIDIAVETLRVAEYLTPYLQKALAVRPAPAPRPRPPPRPRHRGSPARSPSPQALVRPPGPRRPCTARHAPCMSPRPTPLLLACLRATRREGRQSGARPAPVRDVHARDARLRDSVSRRMPHLSDPQYVVSAIEPRAVMPRAESRVASERREIGCCLFVSELHICL
jgi:hypothetical protein